MPVCCASGSLHLFLQGHPGFVCLPVYFFLYLLVCLAMVGTQFDRALGLSRLVCCVSSYLHPGFDFCLAIAWPAIRKASGPLMPDWYFLGYWNPFLEDHPGLICLISRHGWHSIYAKAWTGSYRVFVSPTRWKRGAVPRRKCGPHIFASFPRRFRLGRHLKGLKPISTCLMCSALLASFFAGPSQVWLFACLLAAVWRRHSRLAVQDLVSCKKTKQEQVQEKRDGNAGPVEGCHLEWNPKP